MLLGLYDKYKASMDRALIKSYFQTGLIIAVTFMVLSLFSIFFVDKNLALWVHTLALGHWRQILNAITKYGIFICYVCFILIIFTFSTYPIFVSKVWLGLYLILGMCATFLIESMLKVICGRDWPDSWAGSHQSLLQNNVYQFNFLTSTTWHGSFPSGHTVAISFISTIMCLLYPRFKYIGFFIVILMLISLVLLNYHYLGDCLAGIGIGCFCAYYWLAGYLLVKGG